MQSLKNTDNGSVLLVEDHREASEAMELLLGVEGISTVTAENGAEALTKIKTQGPVALVLLDLVMPVMNGWEFLRRKSADPSIAPIPVIVLTADPWAPQGVEKLKKPVNPELLLKSVKRVIAPETRSAD